MSKNYQFEYKNFFVSLFQRNRNFLILSLFIFLIPLLVGGVGSFISDSLNHLITNYIANNIPSHELNLNVISIFLGNSNNAFLYYYLGGISLGVISTFQAVKIGVINGFYIYKISYYISN